MLWIESFLAPIQWKNEFSKRIANPYCNVDILQLDVVMESKFYLFNQGDGNSDPLPEEDEETDDDEEDDADHRGEREPSISLLQEIVHYFWSPVQLHMHMKARHLDSVSE